MSEMTTLTSGKEIRMDVRDGALWADVKKVHACTNSHSEGFAAMFDEAPEHKHEEWASIVRGIPVNQIRAQLNVERNGYADLDVIDILEFAERLHV